MNSQHSKSPEPPAIQRKPVELYNEVKKYMLEIGLGRKCTKTNVARGAAFLLDIKEWMDFYWYDVHSAASANTGLLVKYIDYLVIERDRLGNAIVPQMVKKDPREEEAEKEKLRIAKLSNPDAFRPPSLSLNDFLELTKLSPNFSKVAPVLSRPYTINNAMRNNNTSTAGNWDGIPQKWDCFKHEKTGSVLEDIFQAIKFEPHRSTSSFAKTIKAPKVLLHGNTFSHPLLRTGSYTIYSSWGQEVYDKVTSFWNNWTLDWKEYVKDAVVTSCVTYVHEWIYKTCNSSDGYKNLEPCLDTCKTIQQNLKEAIDRQRVFKANMMREGIHAIQRRMAHNLKSKTPDVQNTGA